MFDIHFKHKVSTLFFFQLTIELTKICLFENQIKLEDYVGGMNLGHVTKFKLILILEKTARGATLLISFFTGG